jgi:phosphoribosylanthranilate isomerase
MTFHHKTRVKVCGITRAEDALTAAALGVDAIGFVFYEKSPRTITPAAACDIILKLPPFLVKVGLFVNATPEVVFSGLSSCAIDILQFHGDEDENYCRQFGVPYIKALRHRGMMETRETAAQFSSASAILLDSYEPGRFGGTGHAFDWSEIPELTQPMVLAGGLSPLNVGLAVGQVAPYAVDVSGGVEDLPGIKSPERIQQFMRAVAAADDVV